MKRSLIYISLFLTSLLITQCSSDNTGSKEITQLEWERYAAIKAEAEGFVKERIRNDYEYIVNDTFVPKRVTYQRYNTLFTKENVKLLQRIEETFSDQVDIRSIKNLKTFLLQELAIIKSYDEIKLLKEYDSLSSIAIQNDYYFKGDSVNHITERIALIEKKLLQKEQEVYEEYGYQNITSFLQAQHSFDLHSLEDMTSDFIDSISTIEEKIDDTSSYLMDVPKLPVDSFLYYFDISIRSSGMSINSLPSLSIDISSDTSEMNGLRTYQFDIPNDIRVIGLPNWAISSHYFAYSELGAALSITFTEEKEFELNYLSDNSVSELYYALFGRILIRSIVLGNFKSINNSDYQVSPEYINSGRFEMIKHNAKDCLYELKFYSGISNPEEYYLNLNKDLFRAKNNINPISIYDGNNLFFASGLYASFFEPYFAAYLTEHYGYDFFNNPEAWDFIKDIWKQGNRLTIDDIAKMIGQEDFGAELLIKELKGEVRY